MANEQDKKTLFIAGKFNDEGGKASGIARRIFEGIGDRRMEYVNGGRFELLEKYANDAQQYGVVCWFADVPNDKPKLVEKLKESNQSLLLVTSKRNRIGDNYAFSELIGRALKTKSNLLIEFTEDVSGTLKGRIMDPLGNVFLDANPDFHLLGEVLAKRMSELQKFTRIGSNRVGERVSPPDNGEFFKIVRDHSDTFHEVIDQSLNTSGRFLGNASFRCENGFPSMRGDGEIFVSRRNIDKKSLNVDGFVAVLPSLPVKYFGDAKPSVDTPIQIQLYDYYSNVNFMLHSHVYARDASFTKEPIPCGALEEVDAIKSLIPDRKSSNFSVNLLGHGSIAMANGLDYMKKVDYYQRPFPEIHPRYLEEALRNRTDGGRTRIKF